MPGRQTTWLCTQNQANAHNFFKKCLKWGGLAKSSGDGDEPGGGDCGGGDDDGGGGDDDSGQDDEEAQ